MKTYVRLWLGGLLVLLAGLLQAQALGQVPDRVGRIAYLSGDVQFYAESARAWEPAQLNAPVSSHNSLFAGAGSRAEIRFGTTALALDSQTQLNIHQLDDDGFKASVGQGSLSLRVPRFDVGEVYELSAPGARYQLLQAGRFRIDAGEGGSSVTVFAGAVRALLASGTVLVEAGKTLTTSGGGYLLLPARSSALDAWTQERERAYRSGQATRYVSPYMTGYEDLDANGRWAQDPDYGVVWYPSTYISAGWAPYRDGRWVYRPPWGWTWVDAAPWGFAPFHYGRWVRIGASWAWAPGGYVARPSYAPALVVFIGGGSNGGIGGIGSIGGLPSVGWYPLPPWEHYRPAYAHSPSTLRNLNNFTLASPPPRAWTQVGAARVLENQRYGATLVPQRDFVASRPVARSTLSVPLGALPTLAPLPVPPAPQAFPPAPRAFPAPGETGSLSRERAPISGALPRDGASGGRRDAAPAPAEAPRLVAPARPAPPTFGGEREIHRERPMPVAPEGLPGREATGAPRGFAAPLPRPPVPAAMPRNEPMATPRLDSPTPRLSTPPVASPGERPLPVVPLPERRFGSGEAIPVPLPRLAEPPRQRYELQGRPEPGRDAGREPSAQPHPRFGSGDSGGSGSDSGSQGNFRGGDGGRRFGGPER